MGQKVNPKSFRLGIIFPWDSKWFAPKNMYAKKLRQDVELKKFLKTTLKNSSIAKIEIERTLNVITVVIHSAKPGVVIGRQGAGVEELKKKIKAKFFASSKITINISILEVDKPGANAELVVQGVCEELQKRMPFRRVMKQVIERVQKSGVQGVKILIGGRLNGAEIANRETLFWGKIPLHTIRANIDYSRGTARTAMGAIGVKVWIYKGEIFDKKNN